MEVYLCGQCYLQGYCRRLVSFAATDADLTPAFLRDLRAYARAMQLTPDAWEQFLAAAYRDYPGRIVDRDGEESNLDTSVFDAPEIRTWFRDMCRVLPDHVCPRLRREARERYKVLASILRARDPVGTRLWSKPIANDNEGGGGIVVNAPHGECPYPRLSYRHPPQK